MSTKSFLGIFTLIFLLTTLYGVVLVHGEDDEEGTSAYIVELQEFKISPEFDTKWIDWKNLRMSRAGRNKFVVGGNVSLNLNLADEQSILLEVYQYPSKTKGPLVMKMEKPVCQFIREDNDIYPGLLAKSNFPPADQCPLAKGDYEITKYEVQADFLPDNTPPGEYLIQVQVTDKGMSVTGFEAGITLE